MIEIENLTVCGLEAAVRGMRNPMNSWDAADGYYASDIQASAFGPGRDEFSDVLESDYRLGERDKTLACKLSEAALEDGNYSHSKYRRFITVTCDIVAPLYWWKEMDQYKVGTVTNSCSTMHKITSKEFVIDDFSTEHLCPGMKSFFNETLENLNSLRDIYLKWDLYSVEERQRLLEMYPHSKKDVWYNIIQLLPSSYNQRRTWMANYEVISNIIHQRLGHKLDEWRQFTAIMYENLPYRELLI